MVRAKPIPMAPGYAACSLCAVMEDRLNVPKDDWIQPFSYLPKKHIQIALRNSLIFIIFSLAA